MVSTRMTTIPKKLINSVDDCVDEMMEGFSFAYPGSFRLHPSCRKLAISTLRRHGCVSLLSGGGAGHEPFCAGYVGKGMLTAAISGTVFSSPPASNIFEAIQLLSASNAEAGVFVIIPNYTGDRLNFGLAIEKARTMGIKVDSITIGEDCAHSQSKADFAGRRGLCGLVLAYKIAGAMAIEGRSLKEISSILHQVVNSMATIGICLTPCSLPAFTLEPEEIELGVGVHGESGVLKMKMGSAAEVTTLMLEKIREYLLINAGDEVIILVNNLGSATQMEQWIVVNEIKKQLSFQNVKVLRIYAGHIMTSLDMSGMHICMLKLSGSEEEKNDLMSYLDAPTLAPAWPGGVQSIQLSETGRSSIDYSAANTVPFISIEDEMKAAKKLPKVGDEGKKLIRCCIESAVKAIIEEEDKINFLDSKCGDSDCGTTLRRGAEGIKEKLDTFPLDCPGALMKCLASACEPCMAGTSGGIYSILFTTCTPPLLLANTKDGTKKFPWAEAWGKAWRCGLEGVLKYCGAKSGDRTLLDVLEPACAKYEALPKSSLKEILSALDATLEAAEIGCRATGKMKARVGRASYVDSMCLHEYDAGAYGVLVWIRAVINTLKEHLLDK
ncbi:hypothetical protein J437_LFUL016507 [Ladona fulva]|uniref:Triokinase/FMN cyclase n=1 Tax=Ladona fulva TaxID=123851 RepID=A0A8K0P696_LADFU|nr:hypothetical protein J437_LFUL016507 [Ladona fulva]